MSETRRGSVLAGKWELKVRNKKEEEEGPHGCEKEGDT